MQWTFTERKTVKLDTDSLEFCNLVTNDTKLKIVFNDIHVSQIRKKEGEENKY